MQMKSSAWQHRQQTLQAFKNLPIAWFLISTITLLSPSQIPVLGRLQCMNLIQLTWPLWVLTSYLLQKTHHQSSLYFTSQKLYRPVPWMWGMLCCNWTRALLIQQNCMPCSLLPPHWTIPLTSQSPWIREVQSRAPLGCSNLNTYISKFDHLSWTWQTTLWIRLKWTNRWFLGTLLTWLHQNCLNFH